MKSYSVKQIAEMLHTNPETVRRWIRDKKLKAVQISKKTGNIVTEEELTKFIKSTPKYLPSLSAGLAAVSPVTGIAALAGGLITGIMISFLEETKKKDIRIQPEDIKRFLQNNISDLENTISQKRQLIQQTETEISNLSEQIAGYEELLKNEDLILSITENTNQGKGD